MKKRSRGLKELPLHIMLLPGVILLLIFSYIPMAGIMIAFQNYNPAKGYIFGQVFSGLDNFRYIFSMPNIGQVFWNTLFIAVSKIILGMIVPIIISLLLNELRTLLKFKRTVQTIIYFPYFLSWIILSGVFIDLLSPESGVVNQFIQLLGFDPIYFLGDKKWFPITMIITDSWKNFGFGTIIYLATITGIDPALYEAAAIDGASRLKQTLHITLPSMRMIIVLMLVLSLSNVLNGGFDQIFNLYNPQVMETGDILDTLVYRMGLEQTQYGPATAVGLLKSVISSILISGSYYISYKFFDYKLF